MSKDRPVRRQHRIGGMRNRLAIVTPVADEVHLICQPRECHWIPPGTYFTPAQARKLAKALNEAADIVEKETQT